MIRKITIIAVFLLSVSTAFANQFVRIAGDVEVPIPANWYLATDTMSFPVQLIHLSDSAEVLIFRSDIAKEDLITNEQGLKKSVDLVINDVINTLPHGQLRISTGFYDKYRTGFTLEFASTDSASGVPLEHSLKGIIYRLPGSRQVLFTVWGKAAASAWPTVRGAVKQIHDEFAFRGKYENEVFGGKSMGYWPIILVATGLLAFLLLRPKQKKKKEAADSQPPSKPI
jgi:hypothetical protein